MYSSPYGPRCVCVQLLLGTIPNVLNRNFNLWFAMETIVNIPTKFEQQEIRVINLQRSQMG